MNMGILRNIATAVGKWFSRPPDKPRKSSRKAPADLSRQWVEDIESHLGMLKEKGNIHLNRHNTRQEWECTLPSMLDAYLFYISLPGIIPEKVEAWCSADDLFYTYRRLAESSITLTDRVTAVKDYDAVISLSHAGEILLRISIHLETRKQSQPIIYDADTQNQQ